MAPATVMSARDRPGNWELLAPPAGGFERTAGRQPLEELQSQGLTASRGSRAVRGRVGVEKDVGIGSRPKGGHGTAEVRPSKPIWLQSTTPTQDPAPVADKVPLWLQHGPVNHDAVACRQAPESREARREVGEDGVRKSRREAGELGGAAEGGDRQVTRLKQEVKRLTQRLQEMELINQEDGLPSFRLEDVDMGAQIAQGGFCTVHHAVWRRTPVAVKKIFDPVITEELRSEFENEVRMLRRLRHPNVVTLMGVCRVPPALSILTELITGGSFFEFLHGPPPRKAARGMDCEPNTVLPILQQAATGLVFLHDMMTAHRDVKSHNVLLTAGQRPIAKWCDFGLARLRSELCTGTMQYAGTPQYMAPELFAQKKYDDSIDVFAFGVMLWEALSQEIPHANMEPPEIADRVQRKDGASLAVVNSWPKSFKDLIRTSLAVLPKHRPSMAAVLDALQQVILDFRCKDR